MPLGGSSPSPVRLPRRYAFEEPTDARGTVGTPKDSKVDGDEPSSGGIQGGGSCPLDAPEEPTQSPPGESNAKRSDHEQATATEASM